MEELKKLYTVLENDLCLFSEFFCSDSMTADIPDFHKEIYSLVPDNERLVMAAPRGFAKSYITSKFYPLWCALFKKKKDICIISASESLAVEHMRYIKQKLESDPRINELWGSVKSDKWTENHIIVKHADGTLINIRAKGAGAQIRGFRPDCIILDDMETDDGVESEDQRKKLKTWLFKACINTLVTQGQLIIIGTVLHPLSVLADLLAVDNGWVKRKYRAYIDGIQEEGNELWPQLWPHERLQSRKQEIGSTAFASEFLNDPLADENAVIKEEQIRYWDSLPEQYSVVIAVDPAYTEDPNNDYKVAALVAIDQNHNRYLIDYIRNHDSSGKFINAVLNMYVQNQGICTSIGMPKTGGDSEFWNSMIRQAEERNIYPPFVELKNAFVTTAGKKIVNKHKRIGAALQPLFEKGKYYIHPNHLEARDELLTIGSSRWDDLVDAMAYAEQILTPVFFDTEGFEDDAFEHETLYEGYGIEY